MKRPRQHVMEDISEQALINALPKEWIVRPIVKDYGVDYEIELVDQEIVSGNRIWVQLKSVEKAKLKTAKFDVSDRFPDLKSDGGGLPLYLNTADCSPRDHRSNFRPDLLIFFRAGLKAVENSSSKLSVDTCKPIGYISP